MLGMMEKHIYSIFKFSRIFTVCCVFFLQPSIFFFFTAMKHLSAINRHKQTTLLAGGTQCVIQWCKGVNLANISVNCFKISSESWYLLHHPTDWGPCRPQKYIFVISHRYINISRDFFIIPFLYDFVNHFVPNDATSFLFIFFLFVLFKNPNVL